YIGLGDVREALVLAASVLVIMVLTVAQQRKAERALEALRDLSSPRYDNIRNAMRYIISVHVPTAGMSFLPLMLGWPLLLFPVHVVFLEFVIDPACTIVFEAERTERGVMNRPPRDPHAPLFDTHMLRLSLLLGVTMLAAVLAAYAWAVAVALPEAETRALGF